MGELLFLYLTAVTRGRRGKKQRQVKQQFPVYGGVVLNANIWASPLRTNARALPSWSEQHMIAYGGGHGKKKTINSIRKLGVGTT